MGHVKVTMLGAYTTNHNVQWHCRTLQVCSHNRERDTLSALFFGSTLCVSKSLIFPTRYCGLFIILLHNKLDTIQQNQNKFVLMLSVILELQMCRSYEATKVINCKYDFYQ